MEWGFIFAEKRGISRVFIAVFLLLGWLSPRFHPASASVTDSYVENFDGRSDGAGIEGYDYWEVMQGNSGNALVKSGNTVSGSGKALVLNNAVVPAVVRRPRIYPGLTPTWVSFRVMVPTAAQTPAFPSGGIAAVCLNYNGRVLASDAQSWLDTGQTYKTGIWYDVVMKLDFENHTYDLYFNDALIPNPLFIPVKSGLGFIDASINSLNALSFYGVYSSSREGSVYIDNVSVIFIDRLQIITAPNKMRAGDVSGPITVHLQDVLSEPQAAPADISLELRTSSSAGRFSASPVLWQDIESVIIPKDAQSAVFYYKDGIPGKPLITVSEYPDRGYTDASQSQEITSTVSYFDVAVMPSQTAGASFGITITAKDAQGNTDEDFSGSVNLTADYISPASGSCALVPESVSGFKYGVLETVVSYADCGIITITASDAENPLKSGASTQVMFLPASFSLSAENSKQVVSRPFTMNVTALNAAGAAAANYNGNVKLVPVAVSPSAVPGAAFTPSVIAGTGFEKGTAAVPVSYNRYGRIKIKAEDASDNTKYGTSADFNFLPGKISLSVVPPSSSRVFFYLGEPAGLSAAVEDYSGNQVVNYSGMVELLSDSNLVLPLNYTFTESDAGKHVFSASSLAAGTYTVTMKCDEAGLTVESGDIEVKNAVIEVIDTTSSVGSGRVIIQIVDESGNVITGENGLAINVTAAEENDNKSVSLPSGALTFTGGRVVLTVSDDEAETVTIIPSSAYKIGIKKGSITFNRTGKNGISTKMWRELKKKR
ncbi:MAG: hypothetical protein PHC33_02335 [Candidatus Omnitrophica bacterium]|nr:hypothetical protein [Candidatus Omnitrophota bacterium]